MFDEHTHELVLAVFRLLKVDAQQQIAFLQREHAADVHLINNQIDTFAAELKAMKAQTSDFVESTATVVSSVGNSSLTQDSRTVSQWQPAMLLHHFHPPAPEGTLGSAPGFFAPYHTDKLVPANARSGSGCSFNALAVDEVPSAETRIHNLSRNCSTIIRDLNTMHKRGTSTKEDDFHADSRSTDFFLEPDNPLCESSFNRKPSGKDIEYRLGN